MPLKTGDELVALLGAPSDDPRVVAALKDFAVRWPPRLEDAPHPDDLDPYAWRPSSPNGFEFGFIDEAFLRALDPGKRGKGPLVLNSVCFYGEHEGVRSFMGAPPFGLTMADSRSTVKDLIAGLAAAWPVLTTKGTWSLTAQYMHETNDGRNCFNWNLGNVKSPRTNVLHMYLRNNVEIEHGQPVIRQPPNPSCRFRAYSSLAEGIQHWIGYYTRLVAKRPEVLTALNAGDLGQVAHILREVGYYTDVESLYVTALTRKWTEIAKALKTTP